MTTPNHNHNQPGGGAPPYDINSLFKPSSNPQQQQPNPNTNNFTSSPFPYAPPPTFASSPPQQPPSSPAAVPYYHQYHHHQLGMELTVNPAAMVQPGVMRMPSSKLPKGRRLVGDPSVYDINVRLQGEVQPQLEVTPITKYNSDPQLVVGRQIAVNKTYICYVLKLGNIRVLNINTALR